MQNNLAEKEELEVVEVDEEQAEVAVEQSEAEEAPAEAEAKSEDELEQYSESVHPRGDGWAPWRHPKPREGSWGTRRSGCAVVILLRSRPRRGVLNRNISVPSHCTTFLRRGDRLQNASPPA